MSSAHGEFGFEKSDPERRSPLQSRRDRETAEQYLATLLKRLTNGTPHQLAPGGKRDALVRYCMDVLMSLDWYHASMRQMQAECDTRNNLALASGIGAVVAVLSFSLVPHYLKAPPVTEAQVTLIIMGFFYVLRQLYAGTDYKARLGAFWQASAALKANFYGLEESWRGKAVVDPTKNDLTDNFYDAIKAALKEAQSILDTERKSFFGTFKNPSEVLGEALSSFKEMRGEAATYGEAATEALKHGEAEAQSRLSAAQAVVAQEGVVKELEFVIERLQAKGDKSGKLASYEEELFKAEARLATLKARRAELQPQ